MDSHSKRWFSPIFSLTMAMIPSANQIRGCIREIADLSVTSVGATSKVC